MRATTELASTAVPGVPDSPAIQACSNLTTLQAAAAAAGVATQGQHALARYNGPITPRFMSHNEIWLALR
jgi:hypothetical protein